MNPGRSHVFRLEPSLPVERQILAGIIRPGSRVLDGGTAATGRSARLCRDLGARVTSIEINPAAIYEFAASGDAEGIELAVGDLAALPFRDGAFDLVLVAFHGIDYLTAPGARQRAYGEMGRVLARRGHIVLNSWNRLATTISPAGLRSLRALRLQLRHLGRGGMLRRTVVDGTGLELAQAFPSRVIREVERLAHVELSRVVSLGGGLRKRSLVTLFAVEPYYVFVR